MEEVCIEIYHERKLLGQSQSVLKGSDSVFFVHRLLLQELEGCLARQPWGDLAVCSQ